VSESRPLHLGVFLGLSASAYALSLACVTALQAESEAAVAASRLPAEEAIGALAARNDLLEVDGARARLAYEQATGAYDRVTRSLSNVEARLADLSTTVRSVDGAARSLQVNVPLPPVSGTVTTAGPPPVHATTAASGG
jgi:hypothetical protein